MMKAAVKAADGRFDVMEVERPVVPCGDNDAFETADARKETGVVFMATAIS